MEARLAALAEKTGRTKSFYAREAITMHLDNLEDMFLALDRLEHPETRWSQDDLERGVDVEG